MSGILCISLDFELHWGGFEKWPLEVQGSRFKVQSSGKRDYKSYFLNTRESIPEMLRLFEEYEVHVTWAAVGMLLNSSRSQLLENSPALKPTYQAKELSAYHFINETGIGEDESSDPFHFAPSLVKRILQTPNQELGTHTYSHFYCNEEGQTAEQFREDLRAAKQVARLYDVKLKSLVFPRNQFSEHYLKVCFEEGITSVRTNPLDWFWHIESTQSESNWKRLNRGLDAYFSFGRKNTFRLDRLLAEEGFPICLPASRLLRPFRPSELLLNEFKINRIKSEMERAAKNSELYHLWWHPHNFGDYPEQSLNGLAKILKHYHSCRKKFDMVSLNMVEIAERIFKLHGKDQAA